MSAFRSLLVRSGFRFAVRPFNALPERIPSYIAPAWRNPAEEVIGLARRVEREAFEAFFINRMIG